MSLESKDHPRACGENENPKRLPFIQVGSPPRMRGKLRFTNARVSVPRITPAHAGKTALAWLPRFSRWDHPRACGENSVTLPARCGQRDHPRACGENPVGFFTRRFSRGSPPRVRGKPAQDFPRAVSARIPPARAGKTTL